MPTPDEPRVTWGEVLFLLLAALALVWLSWPEWTR